MKAHLDIKHEGTLGSEGRTRMTFDEDSITHLMTVLTDLYSDPEKAVIREYASNAWDSHVAAGNTDTPIEIELPTPLNPVFVVRDFGVGLSTDEVVNHLSKYGWSSKRDTDEAVGMLGLGFKSALTYTSQFTLVARKNGLQSTVLVTREESGAGVVQVIDTCTTDEPNGVTIQVPVRMVNSFNQKANFHFRFWEPGSVLVDGEAPEPINGSLLDPDVMVVRDGSIDRDYIVMGNVPYPTPSALYLPEQTGYRHDRPYIVARVPIGCVNFTPSREALQMTKRTEEVLADTRKFVHDCILKQAQDEVEACETYPEAWQKAQEWGRTIRLDRLTYRGRPIPVYVDFKDERTYEWSSHGGVESPSSQYMGTKRIEEVRQVLHVYNYKSRGVTKITKAKVRHWLASWPDSEYGRERYTSTRAYGNHMRVIFYPGNRIGGAWLSDVVSIDYEVLQNVHLPDSKMPVAKKRPKYSTLDLYGDVAGDEELTAKHILWFESSLRYGREQLVPAAKRYFGDETVQVVSVPSNREDKFKKDHPNAVHVGTWVKRALQEFADSMTEAERWAWHTTLDSHTYDRLRHYVPRAMLNKVMDSEFRAVVDELHAIADSKRDKAAWRSLENIKRNFAWRGKMPVILPPDPAAVARFGRRVAALLTKYPLISESGTGYYGMPRPQHQDYLDYLNATHIVREHLHLIRTY